MTDAFFSIGIDGMRFHPENDLDSLQKTSRAISNACSTSTWFDK